MKFLLIGSLLGCLTLAAGCNTPPTLGAGSTPALARVGEAPLVGATSTTYKNDGQGGWARDVAPEQGSDEAVLAQARRELAEDRASVARRTIDKWLKPRERTTTPLVPQAYLIRADATAVDDEYDALYDYETLIKTFPGSPEYVTAVERELEIGVRYLNGLDRKQWGMRMLGAESVGEELLIRVHERLPGSQLGECAVIELGDYYYRELDLESAAVVYKAFVANYPRSAYVMRAKQRQVFSSLGRFKGPRYDTTILLDAGALIRRFQNEYPAQAQAVGLDDALLTRIDESRASQLLEASRWYLKRGDPVSARAELRRLLKVHPRTAAGGKAYDMLKSRGWLQEGDMPPPVPSASAPAPSVTATSPNTQASAPASNGQPSQPATSAQPSTEAPK
ncbi:MAG: outer membrane protein assembly factor BamD [Phycisphaerales bacterium]